MTNRRGTTTKRKNNKTKMTQNSRMHEAVYYYGNQWANKIIQCAYLIMVNCTHLTSISAKIVYQTRQCSSSMYGNNYNKLYSDQKVWSFKYQHFVYCWISIRKIQPNKELCKRFLLQLRIQITSKIIKNNSSKPTFQRKKISGMSLNKPFYDHCKIVNC